MEERLVIRMKDEEKTDGDTDIREHVRDTVLLTLKNLMPRIIKGLEEFNIHFPIQKIAYLEMRGDLIRDELLSFREELLAYLEKGYRFKKYYWKFIERSYELFDTEMKNDESCSPGYKYYQSLRIDMYLALFGLEAKSWSARFDAYIGKIRGKTGGKGPAPRNGMEILGCIAGTMEKPIHKIKERQEKLLDSTREMMERIEELYADPDILLARGDEGGSEPLSVEGGDDEE